MRTSQNIARVSAHLIRSCVTDLRASPGDATAQATALASLEAIADELDHYAPAYEGPTTDTAAGSAASV